MNARVLRVFLCTSYTAARGLLEIRAKYLIILRNHVSIAIDTCKLVHTVCKWWFSTAADPGPHTRAHRKKPLSSFTWRWCSDSVLGHERFNANKYAHTRELLTTAVGVAAMLIGDFVLHALFNNASRSV